MIDESAEFPAWTIEDRRELSRLHAAAPARLSFGLLPATAAFYEVAYRLVPKLLEALTDALEDAAVSRIDLSTACVVGQECLRHGVVHGQEAEELRKGIEDILKGTISRSDPTRLALLRLLDEVDARDSLAFLEASTSEVEDGGSPCG